MKTTSELSRCEQLGVCQAYGTCTKCLMAGQRHPFAPGVIEPDHQVPPRSFAIAVWALVALALFTMGALIWVALDVGGLIPHLWMLVS